MNEPDVGFLLCGPVDEQQLYVRDDSEAAARAKNASGYTLEVRWFHVADGTEVYRFDDLCSVYGPENMHHLTVCEDGSHGCAGVITS